MITLKTLPQATAQEVFDQITQHLLKQGKAAISATGACRYRIETAEGVLKCAAGCLIADDEYNREWENTDWPALVSGKFVPDSHERLIYKLQGIHDCKLPRKWIRSFQEIAAEFSLTFTPPP